MSCFVKGLVLRQIMPIVRDGFGLSKRVMETDAERVSTATAISGIKVTPIPAPTIWTKVDRELASSVSLGRAECMSQNDRAWSRKQCPSSNRSSFMPRSALGLGAGSPSNSARPDQQEFFGKQLNRGKGRLGYRQGDNRGVEATLRQLLD